MHPLARSLTFHLLMPYVVQLAALFLLLRFLSVDGLIEFLIFGGWFALMGIALIGIPFGVAHVIQALYFDPGWNSRRKQFIVGLLNPSFTFLTIAALFFLAPEAIL
jgi:hypothetical protein